MYDMPAVAMGPFLNSLFSPTSIGCNSANDVESDFLFILTVKVSPITLRFILYQVLSSIGSP